jgi:hypothetical protein
MRETGTGQQVAQILDSCMMMIECRSEPWNPSLLLPDRSRTREYSEPRNPTDGDGFLRAIEIRSTPSFGGKVKSSAPCRKILWYVKNTFELLTIHYFLRELLLLCFYFILLVGSPELWWTNQEFSPVDIIPPWFSIFITCGIGLLVAAVQTWSHPIGMIIIIPLLCFMLYEYAMLVEIRIVKHLHLSARVDVSLSLTVCTMRLFCACLQSRNLR